MDNFDLRKETEIDGGEEVYSKAVRAGRRTYFFDVKATRNDDYYLTITESRKKQTKDGTFFFDKHKIYLYKEDFIKFEDGLSDVIAFVKQHKPDFFDAPQEQGNYSDHEQGQEQPQFDVAIDSNSSIDEEFDKL